MLGPRGKTWFGFEGIEEQGYYMEHSIRTTHRTTSLSIRSLVGKLRVVTTSKIGKFICPAINV